MNDLSKACLAKRAVSAFTRRLSIILLCSYAIVAESTLPAPAQQQSWFSLPQPLPFVIPENLCNCRDYTPLRSTIKTAEEFYQKYRWITYSTQRERNLAWRVFRAVSRCDATVIIGRLEDTGQFAGRQGTCVLRDYQDWTPSINDAFIAAGIDQRAPFQTVSPPISEIEIVSGGDMRQLRRNIYNRELLLLRRSGRYRAYGDIANATPENPVSYLSNHDPIQQPETAASQTNRHLGCAEEGGAQCRTRTPPNPRRRGQW